MNSYIQLICLVFSFLFGIGIFYLNKFNNIICIGKNILIKFIINILFINIMALFYIMVLEKLNKGIVHIYFILFILSGYVLISVKKRK